MYYIWMSVNELSSQQMISISINTYVRPTEPSAHLFELFNQGALYNIFGRNVHHCFQIYCFFRSQVMHINVLLYLFNHKMYVFKVTCSQMSQLSTILQLRYQLPATSGSLPQLIDAAQNYPICNEPQTEVGGDPRVDKFSSS